MKSPREALDALLHRYNVEPDDRDRITHEIRATFERPTAVLVLDVCGFSRSVRTSGIVPFLALMQRLTEIVRPAVTRYGGAMLHGEADNLFAMFSQPTAAVECATAVLADLERANSTLPEADRVFVSIGIGYGSMLVIDGETVYGDEMNLAAKLGEDLAQEQEVLLTTSAWEKVDSSPERFEAVDLVISGIHIVAYRLIQTVQHEP